MRLFAFLSLLILSQQSIHYLDRSQPLQPQFQQIVANQLSIQTASFKIMSYHLLYILDGIHNYQVYLQQTVDDGQSIPSIVNLKTKYQKAKATNFMLTSILVKHPPLVSNMVTQSNKQLNTLAQNSNVFPPDSIEQPQQLRYVNNPIQIDKQLARVSKDYSMTKKNPEFKVLFIYPQESAFINKLCKKEGNKLQLVSRNQLDESKIGTIIDQIKERHNKDFVRITFNNRYLIKQDRQSQTLDLLMLEFISPSHKDPTELYELMVYGNGHLVQDQGLFSNDDVYLYDKYQYGDKYIYKRVGVKRDRLRIKHLYRYQQQKEHELIEQMKLNNSLQI